MNQTHTHNKYQSIFLVCNSIRIKLIKIKIKRNKNIRKIDKGKKKTNKNKIMIF